MLTGFSLFFFPLQKNLRAVSTSLSKFLFKPTGVNVMNTIFAISVDFLAVFFLVNQHCDPVL
jgi:hypothetical protein